MYKSAICCIVAVFLFSCEHEGVNGDESENHIRINTSPEFDINLIFTGYFGDSGDVMMGRIGAIAVDDSGFVYISDTDAKTIRVFDSNGSYSGAIAQSGNGPGEFSSVGTIRQYEGELYVLDTGRQLINIYSTSNFRYSRTLNPDTSDRSDLEKLEGARVSSFFIRKGDELLLQFSKLNSADDRQLLYYVFGDGELLSNEPLIELKDASIFVSRINGMPLSMTLPFNRGSLLTQDSESNLYTVWTDEFKIEKFTPDGNLEYTFDAPFQKSELDRTAFIDSYSNSEVRRALQDADYPEDWPALKNILSDDENRLWIATITENEEDFEWWVIDGSGKLITRFEWPREEPIDVMKNGYMYTRQTNPETGLQRVGRYRIELREAE